MRAVIAGGGIGGLAAAVALHRRGVDVVVCERAGSARTAGAALSLWPNAVRALDRLGVGEQVRRHAALGGASGIRRSDGRWIARSQLGEAIEARFGDPLVLVNRATLSRLLLDELPENSVRHEVTVLDVEDDANAAVLHTTAGSVSADLVVAADGIRSTLRALLFPSAEPPAMPATPRGG